MNSRDKWEMMEESDRQRAIAQNGNNGEHYEEGGEQLEFNFWEEQETATTDSSLSLFSGDVAYLHQIGTLGTAFIGIPKTYNLNVDKIKTILDVKLVLDNMNLCFQTFGEPDEKQQNLIDCEIFTLRK
jgi:hypothetical protein